MNAPSASALLAVALLIAGPFFPRQNALGSPSGRVDRVVEGVFAKALKEKHSSNAESLARNALRETAELERMLTGKAKFGRATGSGKGKTPDWEAQLDSARKRWNQILLQHPASPWTEQIPDGLSSLDAIEGRIRLRRGEVAQAAELFTRSFERLWKVSRLSVVPLRVIEDFAKTCSHQSRREDEACHAWLRTFLDRSSETAPERSAILNRHSALLRNSAGVSTADARLVAPYNSKDADEAAFTAVLEKIGQKDWNSANAELIRFQENFPRSSLRFRARWWLARLREQAGDPEAASRWRTSVFRESPFSYYGLHAALKEKRVPGEGLTAEIPPALARDPRLNPIENQRWLLAEGLAARGALAESAFELAGLEPRLAFSSEFLVYGIDLATRVGAHATALNWVTELLKRDVPWARTSYATRWIFPVPGAFASTLRRVAIQESVDPALLLSLSKQESAFNADALSSAGAAGLAQLMPATALEVMPGVERAELRDPERSLIGGARYLKRMLDRYDGNVALALAAYNAGPGAVDRWIAAGIAAGSQAAFIELIPYKETQNYVASILRNRWWYRRILEGKTDTAIDGEWRSRGTVPQESSANSAGIHWALATSP